MRTANLSLCKVRACEKGEQWQQALALDLFVAEQSVELLPDVITCNASISACEKREQWQQALGLPGSLDVFPNSVTYSAAISACEKGEQWQQALDLVVAEQSVELLPDVITCNASPGEQLSPPSGEERTRVEKTKSKKDSRGSSISRSRSSMSSMSSSISRSNRSSSSNSSINTTGLYIGF